MTQPGPETLLTATQLRAAMDLVLAGDSSDPEVRHLIRVAAESRDPAWALSHGDLVFGILTGFELVRRYGLLGAHPSAVQGSAPIIQEIAHRYGLHVAWVSRTRFEDYMSDADAVRLTDAQWAALEDRYDDYDDYCDYDRGEYMQGALHRAGWVQDDDGTWHAPGSK